MESLMTAPLHTERYLHHVDAHIVVVIIMVLGVDGPSDQW